MMPCNIRIIEDNRNNRTLLWDILTFNGYEVSIAIIQEAFRSKDIVARIGGDELPFFSLE